MALILVCAKGGDKPTYITSNIEDLVGFSAEEIMVLPSFESVFPHLAIVQNQLNQELAKSLGQPFHHYSRQGELRHKDGHRIAIQSTVLIARTNHDVLIVNAVCPVCCCAFLREIVDLWPRLSEASTRLVHGIVKSLARLAI